MTSFPLTILVVAPLAGTFSDFIGSLPLAVLGAVGCTIGAGLLAFLPIKACVGDVAWRLAVFGLGTGLFQSPNTNAVMSSVSQERLGIAGGVLAMARSVGMVLGIAVAAVFMSREAETCCFSDTSSEGAYLAAAGFALLGAIASAATYKKRFQNAGRH